MRMTLREYEAMFDGVEEEERDFSPDLAWEPELDEVRAWGGVERNQFWGLL